MNLILLEPGELVDGQHVVLTGTRARHLLTVIKVVPEQTVRVGVLEGPTGIGRVISIGDEVVSLQCAFGETPARPQVDLLLAVPRPKVLRRLWAQIAALGVGRVLLTNAERVERNYFDTHMLDPRGYRPLLIEGLQQARDTRIPIVTIHRRLRILLEDELDSIVGEGMRIVADPGAGDSIANRVARRAASRVLLAVGPEGGWNQFELDLLHAGGFSSVSMGPRTLRSDTACIALLALVHDALRDQD